MAVRGPWCSPCFSGNWKITPRQKKSLVSPGNLNLLARDGAVIGTRPGTWLTKDTPDDNGHPTAVDWVSTGAGAAKRSEFRLGDFARLGAFLAEMIGTENVATHAK